MAVQRLDVVEVPDWISSRFDQTEEGFLKGRAACTNIGVFTYKHGDGTIIRELRLPEEVFANDSMESLKMKPITMDHPMAPVNADNIKELAIGTTGASVMNGDNIYLSVDMLITDKDAIDQIKEGKNYLSCGYSCDVEFTKGRWLGMEYDAVQKNIRYNHVSVVDSPRAGETAKIKIDHMDALDAILVEEVKEDAMPDKAIDVKDAVKEVLTEQKLDELLKVNIDLTAKVDSLTVEKTALEAERDTLKDKVDALEAKITDIEAKITNADEITAKVNARVALIEKARSLEVEAKSDMAEIEIKKAVITKVFPKANLEDKSDQYIDARFDAAIEYVEEQHDAEIRKVQADTAPVKEDVVDSKKAREEYIKKLVSRDVK